MNADLEASKSTQSREEEPFIPPYFIPDSKQNVVLPPRPREPYPEDPWYNKLTCSCKSKRCCCCRCTWKCCGVGTFIVVLLIGLILGGGYLYLKSRLTGTATSKDKDLWEATLGNNNDVSQIQTSKLAKSIIDGEFLLVSYDENYPDYLKTMGIPGFVVNLILSSKEILIFKEPTQPGGNWTMNTKTDLMDRNAYFRIGEPFEMEMGMGNKKGLMVSNCTISGPADNILSCDVREKIKDWNFKSESIYTKAGFINTRTFLNKNMSTKKYYKRISKLEFNDEGKMDENNNAQIDELNNRISKATEPPKVENLFSDDDDDPFKDFGKDAKKNSEWDDPFFNDD